MVNKTVIYRNGLEAFTHKNIFQEWFNNSNEVFGSKSPKEFVDNFPQGEDIVLDELLDIRIKIQGLKTFENYEKFEFWYTNINFYFDGISPEEYVKKNGVKGKQFIFQALNTMYEGNFGQ